MMKVTVISYSFTGNNDTLSTHIAGRLGASHIRIIEARNRTMGTIFWDMLFNRTPRVDFPVGKIPDDGLVIFVAPVWMGKVATPLRACFR